MGGRQCNDDDDDDDVVDTFVTGITWVNAGNSTRNDDAITGNGVAVVPFESTVIGDNGGEIYDESIGIGI